MSLAAAALALASAQGDFVLHGLDGNERRIRAADAKATVVIFVSAVCPISQEYEQRYRALVETFASRGVQFVFAYSNRNESPDEIRKHAAAFAFPVYRDRDQRVADLFSARVTPTAVLLDARGELVYRGRIDDSTNPARVKDRSLDGAIRVVLAGGKPKIRETKAFG